MEFPMNQGLNRIFRMLLVSVPLVSIHCATPLTTQHPLREEPVSYLVLDYEYHGSDQIVPREGCSIRFYNITLGEPFEVPLRPQGQPLIVRAAPGNYTADRLYCRLTSQWKLERLFPRGLVVEADKYNFAGKVHLMFSASDLETIRLANRAETMQSLAFVKQQLDSPQRALLVSAFTGKSLDVAPADLGAGEQGFRLSLKGSAMDLDPLTQQLETCRANAVKMDPLMVGHLAIKAQYENGRLTNLENESATHAFSPVFENCVEDSVRRLRTTKKSKVKLSVIF
jgi:hypothetical protein